jgi:hypothetical protein
MCGRLAASPDDQQASGKGSVRSDLLGTTRRSDGATQVTYADHPLYFYAHEGEYQVLCHNINESEAPGGRSARRRPRPTLGPATILSGLDNSVRPFTEPSLAAVGWRRSADKESPALTQRVCRQELGACPVSRLKARLKASSES